MTLDFEELEKALALVIEHLKQVCPDGKFRFRFDYYRWFDSSKFFEVYSFRDDDITIGDISDDIASLVKVANGEDEASLVNLNHLAAVLIGIQSELLFPRSDIEDSNPPVAR